MRYLRQVFLILLITFLGEAMRALLPFPIPSGIYGMILLFLALETGILHTEDVGDAANWLITIMPVLFIPAGAGLISVWDQVSSRWLPLLCVILLSTVLVMGVSGRVTQALIRKGGKRRA